ncbi:heparinase II/III family protein [Paenibacillus lactis]|uniref:heparinase II/III family protein n=1 Tax=Paenibacillus lactis TaxID=228574 RepID=UPI00367A2808
MNADAAEALMKALLTTLDPEDPAIGPMLNADDQGHRHNVLGKLHEYFSCRRTAGWRMSREGKRMITDYVKQHCGDELEIVMKTANEVVQQTFLFRFPWDMERSIVPVTFDGDIDWCHIPDQDVEWAYMLNRHRYWVALGQAYAMTGDEKYAEVFCRQLEHWIDRNPVLEEPTTDTLTWRPIEAGLRSANWIKALRYMIGSPSLTPSLLGKALISLHEHGEYLAASFTSWKHISNWGVLETCGLYHIALFFPEFTQSAVWREMGEERLKETARLQIMADGIHWEQSPTYHHEVLACYLDCVHLAKLNGSELDDSFCRTVLEMAEASLYWAKPNHRQPMLGDSDDSDIRSILTFAA